jgi:putative restriction endonuclease
VNFWQPRGARRFAAIPPGAPFLFKSHFRDGNRIVGGGFLSGWASLPVSQAWEFFGPANGCASLADLQVRIGGYRRNRPAERDDPEIGCIMLRDVRFFPPGQAPAAPSDWSPNLVQGRGYDLTGEGGSYVEAVLAALLSDHLDGAGPPGVVGGDVFGAPQLSKVRVGQFAFKALVQEAYGRRCAVTGDKIVPVLQAAHIRPVSQDGENRVDNGLLLRSDVHTLFDRGYLGVHPERKSLLVSPRLRRDWGNGEEFYRRAGTGEPIRLPTRRADAPDRNLLTWHADLVFLAS